MKSEQYTIKDFLPLVIIFISILTLSIIISILTHNDFMFGMRIFMGGFLSTFGILKIIKLKGFAEAYQEYDIVAIRSKQYAYIYPFIELSLGILFFTNLIPLITNITTIILMLISALGVYIKLRKKEKIICACLGTVFKIPMTKVTLFENLTMALMASIMILNIT